MRKPSVETELRNTKSLLRRLQEDHARLKGTAEHYHARALKAEAAVAEWKQRFDALLKIVPASSPMNLHQPKEKT